ncbi:unnamed protein product [Closterium sp. NIES-53]
MPELDPDVHADPKHHWDIATMTVKEALESWKGKAVKAAMDEEIRSLIGMGTWELVERPRGVNIMKNRWVPTTKYRIDDTVEREKARLVVKGFSQVYGADYDETYSPVSSYVTLRIFLSIIDVLDLNLMQLNMKNAFLQSKLDQVLYIYQPDYFDDGTGRVCKLLKSLYGLKQTMLLWYRALDGVLLGAGWKKSKVDEALYFKVADDGVTYWVLVYVNDLLAASSSTAMLKELKELMDAAFELREISPVVKGYADKLHRRFIDEEQGGRVPKTPVSVDAYAELTPDIAFTCSKVGSGLTVRSDQHWREVDHCLAYLADTRGTALEFGGGPESLNLIGYVDADDTGDKQNRTSTGGYVFIYGGVAVSWLSSLIKCATLSSSELEYVTATNAGKEGHRLRFLLAEFQQLNAGKLTVLCVDNKPAITVADGFGLTGNLKQMEGRYAWLQHMVRREKFVLKYIPTTEQPANFPTTTLRWTREVGDASVFRVWGSRAFVRDMSVDKLSACAIPCDVTFDELVPFYRLFPYHSAPPPPPPLFLARGPPPVDPLPPQGPAPSGVSQVDPLPSSAPVQVAVSSGAARGAASGGTASGGAELGGAESEGAGSGGAGPGGEEPVGAEPAGVETGGVEPGGAESEGVESGGAEPRGAASPGAPAGASPRLSPQQLREWFARRPRLWSGATGAGDAGDGGDAGFSAGAGESGATGAGGSGAGGTKAGGAGAAGAGGAGPAGAGAVDPGAGGVGDTVRPQPYFVPLLQQFLGVSFSTSLTPPFRCPPPDQSQLPLQPASPLPAPSPYT